MKTEKSKNKDILGLWLLWVGALFLVNPLINTVDVIPDTAGYILMAISLRRVAPLHEGMKKAMRCFVLLALISAAQLLCSLGNPFFSDSYILLMTFSFAILQGIVFIPAISGLFAGFDWIGTRYELPAAQGIKKRNGKTVSLAAVRGLTVAAFLVREAGSVIPAVPAVTMTGVTYFPGAHSTDWTLLTPPLYVLSWIAGIAVSVPWIIRFVSYVKGVISGGGEVFSQLYHRYETEYLSDVRGRTAARMKTVLIMLCTAAALSLDMYVDGINIFPGLLVSALMIAAFALMMPTDRRPAVAGMVFSSLRIVLSAAGEVLQYLYKAQNYKPKSAAFHIGDAPVLYLRIEIIAIAEALCLAASVIFLFCVLRGTLYSHASLFNAVENLPLYKGRRKKSAKRCLPRFLTVLQVLWFAVALSGAALTVLLKYFPQYWLINGLLCAILTALSVRTFDGLYATIYETEK